MKLTSKQRAFLRAKANGIKPTFQIGALEIHESNIRAIEQTFNNNELIKIKINRQDKTDKEIMQKIADTLDKQINTQTVGIIGTTLILYKEHKDKSKRMKING